MLSIVGGSLVVCESKSSRKVTLLWPESLHRNTSASVSGEAAAAGVAAAGGRAALAASVVGSATSARRPGDWAWSALC